MKEFQITINPFYMRVYQAACGCMVAKVIYKGNDWDNNFDGLKLHIRIAHNNQIAALENAKEVVNTIIKLKPSAAKGTYVLSIYLSTTMSPGLQIDPID